MAVPLNSTQRTFSSKSRCVVLLAGRSLFILLEKNGTFAPLTAEWLSCTNITEPFFNKRQDGGPSIESDMRNLLERRAENVIVPLECPLVWARESNSFDCVCVYQFARCMVSHNAAVNRLQLWAHHEPRTLRGFVLYKRDPRGTSVSPQHYTRC